MAVTILIPAYKPGPSLIELARTLSQGSEHPILIVNDGSGLAFEQTFAAVKDLPRVQLLRHAVNLGKGAALKTGINEALCRTPDSAGVVTADADGQHAPEDILRVASALEFSPNSLVMGVRRFDTDVPLRSWLGNAVTRWMMWLLVGHWLTDTQTGLRGIPQALMPRLLKVVSRGYDFELDMLIAAKHQGCPVREEVIRTIYLEENKSSHFNPIRDSMRIYFVLLRFSALAVATALVDNSIFALTYTQTSRLGPAQIVARCVAVVFQYSLARRAVFLSHEPHRRLLPRYLLLVLIFGLVSYGMITLLHTRFQWSVLPAKLLVESVLFIANFALQRDLVFTSTAENESR